MYRLCLILALLFQLGAPQNLRVVEHNMATFGNTNVEASTIDIYAAYIYLVPVTLSENGTVTAIKFHGIYTVGVAFNAQFAIYDNSSPRQLKCYTDTVVFPYPTAAWVSGAVNQYLDAGDYWLAIWAVDDTKRITAATTGPARAYKADADLPWPSTITPDGTTGTNTVSAYAEYTPAASGPSIPLLMANYRRRRI